MMLSARRHNDVLALNPDGNRLSPIMKNSPHAALEAGNTEDGALVGF